LKMCLEVCTNAKRIVHTLRQLVEYVITIGRIISRNSIADLPQPCDQLWYVFGEELSNLRIHIWHLVVLE